MSDEFKRTVFQFIVPRSYFLPSGTSPAPTKYFHGENEMLHGSSTCQEPPAERESLINGLILIGLGLSIFFLNLWDNTLVRAGIGLFWGGFFLILNWPELVALIRMMRSLRQSHD